MASSVHSRTPVINFPPLSTPIAKTLKLPDSCTNLRSYQGHFNRLWFFNEVKGRRFATLAVANARELDLLPVHGSGCKEQDGATVIRIDREGQDSELMGQMVGGFKGILPLDGQEGVTKLVSMVGFSGRGGKLEDGEGGITALIDRAITAAIILGARSFAITKWLTVGSDCCNEDSDPSSLRAPSCTPVLTHGKRTLETFLAAVLIATQILSPLPNVFLDPCLIAPTNAVLYSPDTKVPRTGELALRRAIPANPNMKSIQESLEGISYLLRIPQRKPYGTMEGSVKTALKIAKEEKDSILASVPADLRERGATLYASLIEEKGGLQTLLDCIKDKDPDRVSVYLASSLDTVAELELLQAPGLQFLLPKQFAEYPTLNGRGVVEFTFEKGDGFFTEAGGIPKSTATVQIVIDGFSAPLTAGNFAKLVIDGVYDGTKLTSTDQAIISDSKLESNIGFSVPLEIMPSGQFEPLYKTALSVQDGELPVLPLSVYGAVAMAHSDVSEEYSSPNQFFFYLYDKRNAGLGGLSFDEGAFSVFGYTTNGREILSQIKSGDIIRSARLLEGRDRLVLPPRGT